MAKRLIVPILFGLVGAAILANLGLWQVQRLTWKNARIAQIEARIGDAPVALPLEPDATRDAFLAVAVSGRYLPRDVHVLTSRQSRGAGYRVISKFAVDNGPVIMVDRGFLRQRDKDVSLPDYNGAIIGNLMWPDEVDGSFTPAPDMVKNIWFARDVPAMAERLGTEEILLVMRESSETSGVVSPWPVDTSGISNDHLEYAITWFSLAFVWLGMTGFWVWRIRRKLD